MDDSAFYVIWPNENNSQISGHLSDTVCQTASMLFCYYFELLTLPWGWGLDSMDDAFGPLLERFVILAAQPTHEESWLAGRAISATALELRFIGKLGHENLLYHKHKIRSYTSIIVQSTGSSGRV